MVYADRATGAHILAAVDRFFDHVANCRLDDTLAAFAPDADAALYGSEQGEAAIGPTALRVFFQKLFEDGMSPRFTLTMGRASVCGDVAWFTCDARVDSGSLSLPYRLTGILERRDGRWLWTLFNGSEPAEPRR